MTEYKGIKYKNNGDGTWLIRWPSGLKSNVKAVDEGALKKIIDDQTQAG